MTATLRILKLATTFSRTLKDSLTSHFAQTPTYPWKSIISQLFSHLNHDEPYIRRIITDLLFRIAKDYPHLIIYPAVVGSQDGPIRIESVAPTSDSDKLYEKSPPNTNVQPQTGKEDSGDEEKLDEENSSPKSHDEEVYWLE